MAWDQLESVSYWAVFIATFLLVAVWETRHPNRDWIVPAGRRWTVHGILLTVSAFISGVILGLTPVMAAVAASGNSWGLLNRAWMPYWVRLVITLLVLDFVKYATHRWLHTVPLLWRIHRMHHADPDFDVSTAGRVHPVEFLFMQGAAIGVIVLLAAPPSAVLVAKLIACVFSFFEHANASLPPRWEQRLRPWLVTPDLHRIHHSERPEEQVRNLGEIFPWWDQVLGTYKPQPEGRLVVGLRGYQTIRSMGPEVLLTLPFRSTREPEA